LAHPDKNKGTTVRLSAAYLDNKVEDVWTLTEHMDYLAAVLRRSGPCEY